MADPLHVLIVEDSEDDALLLLRELRRAGYEPLHERVDSEAGLLAALESREWDVVLSDFAMPGFSGLAAFDLIKTRGLDVPFVFVSGHIGEERAAEAMRQGANDYVLKDNITRLIPAIQRELRDAEVRREHRKMERALYEREFQLSSIYDTVADVIFQLAVEPDGQYRFVSINKTFQAVTGLEIDQVVGRTVQEIIPEPSLSLVLEKYQEAIRGQRIVRWEETSEYPTGRLTGEVSIAPIFDDTGTCTHLVGAVHDITARKRAEERLRAIVDNALDTIAVLDGDAVIRLISPAVETHTGFTPEEVENRAALEFIHPEDAPRVQAALASVLETPGNTALVEYRFRHKEGGWRHFEGIGKNLLNDPAISGVLVNARDITDRHELQAQLLQAQKMEAIGSLAGGVAHDFNNLLSVILSCSGFLLERLEEGDPGREDALEISAAGHRASALTRQLLAFSRRQVLKLEVLDLNEILRNMERMLSRLIREDIALLFNLAERLNMVRADAGQVEQIVMNLAVNARDAMPDGGRLTIETANTTLDEEYVSHHLGAAPGDYVLLAVSDTGTGMDEEVRQHLFEPFFTTKEAGKGTGLGLATVYGIVKQLQGSIWVYSEPGQGTTFKVYLPKNAESRAARPATAAAAPAGGEETILVVEDEPSVRSAACRILRAQGYTVLEAGDGEEALKVLEEFGGTVDLLLTDVVMPNMSGHQLRERLSALRPAIRILFMSGYTNDGIVEQGVLEEGVAFVQKPFTRRSLLRAVREALDAPEKD